MGIAGLAALWANFSVSISDTQPELGTRRVDQYSEN